MRIVITAQASHTHLTPIVLPVARIAQRAGHDVAVATGRGVASQVRAAGLTALTLPSMLSIDELMRGAGRFTGPGPSRAADTAQPRAFAHPVVGELARRHAGDLIEALPRFKPDFILRDGTELGGYLAGERLGIPHGALDIAPMTPFGDPVVLNLINEQRRAFGLSEVDDVWHPFRRFRAGVVPEVCYPPHSRLPGARYYRPSPIEEENEPPLDPAIARLPADRPLVVASLGAMAPRFDRMAPALVKMIVEVLGRLPVTGVVGLGRDRPPEHWDGPRPANVHLTSYLPQRMLLRACDLFVTHAGFNGMREALSAGVPMVAVPLFGDHPANAAQLRRLRVALPLDPREVTPQSLREAVQTVLDDPGYRLRARAVQRQMLALPSLERMIDDIRELTDR